MCEREPKNASDWYAVAVKKEGTDICFESCHGCVRCFATGRYYSTVTGRRKYSADLAQGRLEVPALYFSSVNVEHEHVLRLRYHYIKTFLYNSTRAYSKAVTAVFATGRYYRMNVQ